QEIGHLLIPNSDTSSTQPSDGLIDTGDDPSLEEKYQRMVNEINIKMMTLFYSNFHLG
ncbi:unnamed protein product, partial [Rotaria sordida]